jgi:hypothetical protein
MLSVIMLNVVMMSLFRASAINLFDLAIDGKMYCLFQTLLSFANIWVIFSDNIQSTIYELLPNIILARAPQHSAKLHCTK